MRVARRPFVTVTDNWVELRCDTGAASMGQLFFDMRRLMWPSGPVIRLSKGTLTNADNTEREATDFDSERFRGRVRVAARDIEPWDRDPPAHGGCVRSLHLR